MVRRHGYGGALLYGLRIIGPDEASAQLIRKSGSEVLVLDGHFAKAYAETGHPCDPPEQLL